MIRELIKRLDDRTLVAICYNADDWEETGSTGETTLRLTTEWVMKELGRTGEPMYHFLTAVAFEAWRETAIRKCFR